MGLKVFENRVLRRIFGTKSQKVAGGWGKLHNEKFHFTRHHYGDQIKEVEMGTWM
jgi:hypothetical protein